MTWDISRGADDLMNDYYSLCWGELCPEIRSIYSTVNRIGSDLRYGASITVEIGWRANGFWQGPEKVTTVIMPQSQDIRTRLAFAEESVAILDDCLRRLKEISERLPEGDLLGNKVKKFSDVLRMSFLSHKAFLYFMQAVDSLWISKVLSLWPALKEKIVTCLQRALDVQKELADFETNEREREGLLWWGQCNMIEHLKKWKNLVESGHCK